MMMDDHRSIYYKQSAQGKLVHCSSFFHPTNQLVCGGVSKE
jgi:hypothetical protein